MPETTPGLAETMLRRRFSADAGGGAPVRAPRSLDAIAAEFYGRPLVLERNAFSALEAVYARACRGRALTPEEIDAAVGLAADARSATADPRAAGTLVDDGSTVAGCDVPIVDGVAVVSVRGVLVKRDSSFNASMGFVSTERIAADFVAAMEDRRVKAIMLHVDSPGGQVAGTFELVDRIMAARGSKPIGAYIDSVGASGGYAVACAADRGRITLYRTSVAGSIGAYLVREDRTKMRDDVGVHAHVFRTGAYKASTDPDRAMDDESRASLQRHIDAIGDQFFETVAEARGMTPESVAGLEADTFVGAQAVAAGLADGVGSLREAIDGLRRAADADVSSSGGPAAAASTNTSATGAHSGDHAMTLTASDPNPTKPKAAGESDSDEDDETTPEPTSEEGDQADGDGTDDETSSTAEARESARIDGIRDTAAKLGLPAGHEEVQRLIRGGVGKAAAMETLIGVAAAYRGTQSAVSDALGNTAPPVSAALGGDGAGGPSSAAGDYHSARASVAASLREAMGRQPTGAQITAGMRRTYTDAQMTEWMREGRKILPLSARSADALHN